MLKLQKDFLQKRRLGLEKYLRVHALLFNIELPLTLTQELLLIPAVCRSREFRAFLSQATISASDPGSNQPTSNDFVSRIYNSVADGMEEFLGNIPVLDQLSVAGQNLISAATTQLASSTTAAANGSSAAPLAAPALGLVPPSTDAEAEAELLAFENKDLEPFVKPICDLFLETFELNRENNWLRGRAVVVVLHQLLGGTIERKVRDAYDTFVAEDSVSRYVDMLKDTMWPGGQMKVGTERTAAQRAQSRKEAAEVLATLVPEVAGSVVGRANARMAGVRLEGTVNNLRLK